MAGIQITEKQRQFVEEYLVDLNGTRAAKRAGYSEDTAHTCASRLLSIPKVRAYLRFRMRERMAKLGVTQERVLQEIARVAFSDMRKIADWDASGLNFKPSESIDEDSSAAVAEVSENRGENSSSVKIKLHDKMKALEMLAKHTGLYLPDEESDEEGYSRPESMMAEGSEVVEE